MATDGWGDVFTAFNFSVELTLPNVQTAVGGAFSECDGLELGQEVKTIREGGNNGVQVRLAGPVTYGTLTLKRGMTSSFDLWDWFEQSIAYPMLRVNAAVIVKAPDGLTERVRFKLQGCRPLKIKAPALNARDGAIAIEELQIAYSSLVLQRPQEQPAHA